MMIRNRLCLLTIVAIAALEAAAGQNAVTDWNNFAITAALAANQTTSPGSNSSRVPCCTSPMFIWRYLTQ